MKKSIKIVIVVITVFLILIVVNFFVGNPYSKYRAYQLIEKELQELYPKEDYTLTYKRYDAYNGSYLFEYETEKKAWKYEISVDSAIVPRQINVWQLHSDDIDIGVSDRFAEQSNRYIHDVFSKAYPEVHAMYYIQVPKGFPTSAGWSTELKLDVMPHLSMEYEDQGETKEDFLNKAKEIQAMLKEEQIGYHFARLELIDFNEENGVNVSRERVYFVDFKENDPIRMDDIQVE